MATNTGDDKLYRSSNTSYISHTGKLSLAILQWVCTMSNSDSWNVNRHTAQCTLLVSVVSECKRRSAPPDVPGYSYIFLRSVVCRLSVCHIRVPCLNRTTDLDVIWQVHLLSPMTHGVRSASFSPGRKGYLGVEPQLKHCSQTISPILPPVEYKRTIPLFVKLLWPGCL